MRNVLLLFCALFIMAGCTTLKTTPVIPEQVEVFKPYPIGEVIEKSVGEQMIRYPLIFSLTVNASPGFVAVEEFQPPAFAFGQNLLSIKEGSEWKAIAKLVEGGYLCKNTKESYRALIVSPSGPIQSNWDVCLLVNGANEPFGTATCDIWGPYASVWAQKPENFLQPKRIIEKKEDTNWREALIFYAGKTKDSIRFLYQETALKDREFTFDPSGSNTVTIKDMTFEIIEATNNSIKYIIKTSPDELKSKIEKREKEKKLPEA